jgi:hypothetical protein
VALICKSETAMILLLFGFGLAFGQPLAPTAAPTDAEWTVPKECVASFKYYDVSYNGCTKTGTDGEGETDPWCATETDDDGNFVVGSGNYAWCPTDTVSSAYQCARFTPIALRGGVNDSNVRNGVFRCGRRCSSTSSSVQSRRE